MIAGPIIKRYYSQKRYREGGKGSGNWGHKGRPGKRGGSAPTSGLFTPFPDESPTSSSKLGGGVSYTKLVEFEDGRKAVWKKSLKDRGEATEVAASKLDRLLDLNVVPYTDVGPDDEGKTGSRQRWVEDARVGFYLSSDDAVQIAEGEAGKNIAVLDFLTGQADRHDYNWIVDENDRPYAIDNERVSRLSGAGKTSVFWKANKGKAIPQRTVENLLNLSKSDARAAVSGSDIDIDFLWERREILLRTRRFMD